MDKRIIEAGWAGYRSTLRHPAERDRTAFFAGSHHTFMTVMAILDSVDPTPDALERMAKELAEFFDKFLKDKKLL